MKFDHILVFGFGGPEKPDDILPFLRHVTEGRNIPEPRIRAVAEQYHQIGGKSPYHSNVLSMVENLKEALNGRGCRLPVYIGYRHWHPFLEDTLEQISGAGLSRGAAFVLAPFRSVSSCKRYKDLLKKSAESKNLDYKFTAAWGNHSKLINAVCEELQKKSAEDEFDSAKTTYIFSCHSIPFSMLEMCTYCNYEDELQRAARAVADQCGLKSWKIGYHSRSGNPKDPWLGPDICDVIHSLPRAETERVAVIPLGFICENAEILYDLDILAKKAAEDSGLKYSRTGTVYRNPSFIDMAADMILETVNNG